MKSELLTFKDAFEEMIKTKEVNLDVLPLINKLKEELSTKKEISIKQNLSQHSLFPIYHSINISNNVLDNIHARLIKSKENRDNPKIAEDTLSIYPSLLMLVINMDKLDLKNKDLVTFPLLSLASDLQINAIRSRLFQTDINIEKEVLERAKEVVCNLKIVDIQNDKLQGFS